MPKSNLWPTSSPEYPADPRGSFTSRPEDFAIQSDQPDFLIQPRSTYNYFNREEPTPHAPDSEYFG